MSGPVYFVSDLHVRHLSDARTAAVLRFLHARRGEAEALYLVGDVFDFWLGYGAAMFTAQFALLRALADLVDAGTRVVLFSGNHDPDPGPLPAQLGIEVHEGPLVTTIQGRTVRLEHGDTVDPRGWSRRAVCRLARHPWARAAARRVHPDLAWALSRGYAGGHSAQPSEYDQPLPAALIERYFPARVAEGVDVLVMGHYHRAVHHRAHHAGRDAAYFVLGDWVAQRTWLKADQGEFSLWRDRGSDRAPVRLPEGDFGPEAAP